MDNRIQQKIIGFGAGVLVGLVCLLWNAPVVMAQAPPLPAEIAPDALAAPAAGSPVLKLGILVFDQYSYQIHPFKTLTGDTQFDENIAANGTTGDLGTPATDGEEDFISRALHTLPPFRLDFNWGLNFVFPRGIGVGVDYVHVSQTDAEATTGALDISNIGARLTMDTYILSFPVRFYGFDPREPGINFFFGLSLGFINGNLLVEDATGTGTNQILSFSESPVGSTRMGIEVMGETFGGRFELTMLNAGEVEFDSNPFTGQSAVTTVDMSGILLQLTMLVRLN